MVLNLPGRYRYYDVFLKFKCSHVTHANRHLCVLYKQWNRNTDDFKISSSFLVFVSD